MLREISMYTSKLDLEEALTLLCQSALGTARTPGLRLALGEAADLVTDPSAGARLVALARDHEVPRGAVPDGERLRRLFSDELLSTRALAAHEGRNVYSSGKARIWNELWLPFRDALTPPAPSLALLSELLAMDTRPRVGRDVDRCVDWLHSQLHGLGFSVDVHTAADAAPILVARRESRNMRGKLVMYGHYDIADFDRADWTSDPLALTEREGRLWGVGIGDNKGPLALRLAALAAASETPELVWLIQGEEEVGSPYAHRLFPELTAGMEATLWLDENGYVDLDGTSRLLARCLACSSQTPDPRLQELLDALTNVAGLWRSGARHEYRSLNKDFFPRGCPFERSLPTGARYLAVGINDPASGIHQPDESVPQWTFPLHAAQLEVAFGWVDTTARAEANA